MILYFLVYADLSYRYPGFAETMQSFKKLGFLETSAAIGSLSSWESFISESQRLRYITHPEAPTTSLSRMDERSRSALDWLFGTPGLLPALPTEPMAPLDIFTSVLATKLRYEPGERDMVVLVHEVITKSNGSPSLPEEVHTSSLIAYGDGRYSAMARTVGLPVAIAALRVLDGKVDMRGVYGPGDASVREPVLKGLEEEGLGMTESISNNEHEPIEHRIRERS